ncbi:hypothetical protein BSKO_04182 [Bryopsis sp. KO-2023]|nr:hypothetical protein BSKO_04182 [Bryopsis sp. KO-2023]
MEDLPGHQKLPLKSFPKSGSLKRHPEGLFWRGFGDPVAVQEVGAVTHIDYCEAAPHHFAATSSTRVLVYDGNTRKPYRRFTRFSDKAYSGSFRKDGQLLVAGGEEGIVKVLDANSRTLLRKLDGHKAPCHFTRYSSDGTHVISGADDTTVRWWDISSGEQVLRLDGHRDYIRCGAECPVSENRWATGGYDHVCRLWDIRCGQSTMELDHGAPIESVTFLPSGTLVATAGGPYVCIWDVLGSGQMLRKLANHQKTVTAVTVARNVGPETNRGPRLISASLDSTIKIFDLDTFKLSFMSRYPAPILSLGVNPKGQSIAVGMATGLLISRVHSKERRKDAMKLAEMEPTELKRSFEPREGDFVVPTSMQKKRKMPAYDQHMRHFRYKDAWDTIFENGTPDPKVAMGLFEELAARGALEGVIGGRHPMELVPAIKFIGRYMRRSHLMSGMITVLETILDLYEHVEEVHECKPFCHALNMVYSVITSEINLSTNLHELLGTLEVLLGNG